MNFPFGSPLKKVEQTDRSPKKVFVLGVYASAVHAKWLSLDGSIKVKALAVTSEPYIFWKGDGTEDIINQIDIPSEVGTLVPADPQFNGPSGNALDDLFLKPLGYTRDDAWLCDLLPYSRINVNQQAAMEANYNPLIKSHDLPPCTIPNFTNDELKNQPNRVREITEELQESQADTIILLGDLPIKHWLSSFTDKTKLSDFGTDAETYGKLHEVDIEGTTYKVIPLVHPRQAGNLGKASKSWNELHSLWMA